ncbi:uncharacterized protein LOC131045786 isoform X7 [Cryptomeria japonica]|uniref:uncharacterized protein LOC131045786 isoform X7 n=1 Tax=Cryptomeria japonica TaxID=3369 RepID=UPI0027DA0EA1|nr:uncharacterized protein LOC131045786 isoform X7 [Cryptomeria japonica]
MWQRVGFLLFLLFFSSPAYDVKKFQFVEDDLHNTSAQYYDQVSSCYRKGNPDKCKSFTVRSEIQRLRQILYTHSNRAASGGFRSPSSLCSGNVVLSSSTNLTSYNLVPSANALSSVVESPSVFSNKLQLKRQNWLFSLPLVHIPRRYLLAAPSLPVEPSMNPHTPNHIFRRPEMDNIPPLFSVATHYGQPQYLSPSGSYENQHFIRISSPSSGLSSIIYSPTISDGQEAPGSHMNKIQHLKAAPPLFPSSWPYTQPPLVSRQNLKHQMHQSAFHPVMPNPANPSSKWLSPSFFGAPSEVRPPVSHSWTSATPSGPVVSAPSTYGLGRSQDQPSMPGTALPRNMANRQAPVAMPPMSFSSPPNLFPSEPPMEKSKAPEVVPFTKFSPLGNKHDLKEPSVSPITSPNESPWKNARIPVTALVHKSSSSHAPASGQGYVSSPQISPAFVPSLKVVGYPPPIDLPSEPQEAPPPILSPSHGHFQYVEGPAASSPSVFPFKPPMKKPTLPHLEMPRNRSKRQAPVTLAPKNQGYVAAPASVPYEPQTEYRVTPKLAPSITLHSPPYYQDHQGHVTSPSNEHYRSPLKRPGKLLAPSPIIRSHWHALTIIPPIDQGHFYTHPALPPEQHKGNNGPTASPLIIASQPPQKLQSITRTLPSNKRPWRHAPLAIPSVHEGYIPSQFTIPSGPPKVISSAASAPQLIVPTPHNWVVKGPVSSSSSIIPSRAAQRKPSIPVAAPPNIRLRNHAPVTSLPIFQGPVSSPVKSLHPSSSANFITPTVSPTIISPFSTHRLRKHAPVGSPLIQGSIHSPVRSTHPSSPGNLRTPTLSPSIIFPSHNRSEKHAPVATTPMIQGSVNSPVKSPHPSSSGNLRTPTVSPSIIFPSHNRSQKHTPVATPPMIQGSVNSPVKSPHPSSSGNLRTPTVSPSIIFPSHNRSQKHTPVAAPPMIQGSVDSPGKSPYPSSSGNLRTPTVSPTIIFPLHNRSGKHAPVATPPMIQGSVSSPVKSPHPSSSGNFRTVTVSPSIIFPSSPHNQSRKHAPVASPHIIQGPAHSPVKSPHHLSQNHTTVGSSPVIQEKSPYLPSSGNLRTPTASPPIVIPSAPHHQSWKHAAVASPPTSKGVINSPAISPHPSAPNKQSQNRTPVGSLPFIQGPVYSPENPPDQPSSGNLRTPTASPSIVIPSPPHHRSWKQAPFASPPMSKGLINSPAKSPHPSTPKKQSLNHTPVGSLPFIQGPVYSPENSPGQPSSGNLRSPTASPSIVIPSPPHHRSWKQAPFASPPTSKGHINSPAKSPFPSRAHHRLQNHTPVGSPFVFHRSPKHTPVGSPLAIHRSQKRTPAGRPPVIQGPVYSPDKSPHLPSIGNLRTPTGSPTVVISSPPHHRSWRHAPVASPPTSKGLINSPAISPHPSPLHHQSQKHTPVGSPSTIQGPVYSPEKSQYPPSSGNLRTPTASPSMTTHPYHQSWKHAPVSSPPTRLINSPAKSPHPSPRHHQSQKHTPVGSPSMIQGPVYSPEKSQSPPSSGNLRTPTASPSMATHPYRQSWKHAPVSSPPTRLINSPAESPHPSPSGNLRIPAASPLNKFPLSPHQAHAKGSPTSPNISPTQPSKKRPTTPVAPPPMIFPPPPPGQDCSSVSCTAPYTSTPPGSPCGCVNPMQIELGLGVALYAFFPLVSELASQIAGGTFLKQSQVRIMGANAYSQDEEKTIVDIDLVPLGENFDNTTALLIFERFWQKKVMINETLFGDYWVIFINYPGLPKSPPSAFPHTTYNGVPNSSSNGSSKKDPLGVDVNKQSDKMGAGTIAVVALSSAIAMIICLGTVWIIILKCRNQNRPTLAVVEPTHVPSSTKRSATGGGSILSGSMESSTSMSFVSSMATYTGSAKTFTSAEIEKATDRFNPQKILGEGGFGRVYQGLLEDGTKVAVKVLTRDDQQGGREFIAEVEMLSRLHHRNLVKLIGICTEEHNRCLVYELIPNGSVESHLHGLDKEIAPLDWDARIKIALGAARGLAYLHEDSSPRVIHRDFKASNILLEDDFTPKVADFGLAKSASEEVSGHISTRVMGTFGYVAPEYAMTGHLLVKSDVYSYGVVLLELLSGRKPVDMSQPPGQENLVTWARPLLTSKEGLETLVDPALGGNLPFDNIARVAAIASMCVQPDHSHRPFMGEVVQALKLVYNDSDASNAGGSGSFSRGESSAHDTEVKDSSSQPWHHSMQYVPDSTSFVTIDYDSGPLETQGLEVERPLSASALMSNSGRLIRQLSGSFRRHSSSGPLRTNRSKESWYGIRDPERGSISEHGVKRHFDRGSDGDVHELWP